MTIKVHHILIVAAILLALYGGNFLYAINSDQSGGTFGDTFGAVNALFSGSALFFLVLAFLSQREELKLIKEERDETRELLEGQEEAIRYQRAALEKQIFFQSFNSRMNSALEERARLSLQAVVDGKEKQSKIFKAAIFSSNILKKKEVSDEQIIKELEKLRPAISHSFLYIKMLINLTASLSASNLDDSERSELHTLLNAMCDEFSLPCSCNGNP